MSYWEIKKKQYEAQILAKDDLSYMSAAYYYDTLKNNMINQIIQNRNSMFYQKKIELESFLINEAVTKSSTIQKEAANKRLNELKQAIDAALKNSPNLGAKISQAKSQVELSKKREEYANFSKTYSQKVKVLLGNAKEFKELMMSIPGTSGNAKVLTQQLQSFALRYLINQTEGIKIDLHQNRYAVTMGGYYREQAVSRAYNTAYNQIQKSAEQSKQKQQNFVLGIGKQNIEADLLFNIAVDEKVIEQALNKTYQGQSDIITTPDFVSALDEANKIFGAQVKSWNFEINNGRLGGNHFSIGSRAVLGKMLRNSQEYLYGWDLAANMVFMGQKNNILLALGMYNVMMIDGSKKYWMGDFIRLFRKYNLYLQLDTPRGKPASNDVALYAYKVHHKKS